LHFQDVEAANSRLLRENEVLEAKNRQLKSRIFDSIESEKELREQLKQVSEGRCQHGSENRMLDFCASALLLFSDSLSVDPQRSHRDEDILRLEASLAAKEKENKELMQISEELLKKLEANKASSFLSA
jgi:hypothetical protein